MSATNQKYLQISFALDDGDVVVIMTLPIRPEELTRTEPSRITVVNSLSGAWLDDFGRGLSTINISGHTGWGQGDRPDGASQFAMLRDQFIHRWRVARKEKINQGLDPNDVRLIFIDALNDKYVADVAPTNFVLRRSRSNPLLMMYNISLTAIKEKAESPEAYLLEPIVPAAELQGALASVLESVGAISGLLTKVSGFLNLLGPLGRAAMTMIQGTILPSITKVLDLVRLASSLGTGIGLIEKAAITMSTSLIQTGMTSITALTALPNLPAAALAPLVQMKTTFSTVTGTLRGLIK